MSATANENMEVDNKSDSGQTSPHDELVPATKIKQEIDDSANTEPTNQAELAATSETAAVNAIFEAAAAVDPAIETAIESAIETAIEAAKAVIEAAAGGYSEGDDDGATKTTTPNENGQQAEPMDTNDNQVDTANQVNANQANVNQTNVNQTNVNQTNVNQTNVNQTNANQMDTAPVEDTQPDSVDKQVCIDISSMWK